MTSPGFLRKNMKMFEQWQDKKMWGCGEKNNEH